jgi:hypothetical protein
LNTKHEKLGIGYIYCASINVNAPSAYFKNISFQGHCQKGDEMAMVFTTMDESRGEKENLNKNGLMVVVDRCP